MLDVEGLTPRRGGVYRFRLAPGRCLGVLGPSGSGKTLLLRALADLDACPGQCRLDGTARAAMAGPDWRRRVVYVPAVAEFWHPVLGAHFDAPPLEEMAALGLGADLLSADVLRLSTGQRQRAALVRALVLAPRVLLLDEPTAALDPATAALVEARIARHLAGGGMAVLVTHDRELAARLAADRLEIAAP